MGLSSYTAQIRIKRDGVQVYQESQTFARKQAAQAWARKRESELDEPVALNGPDQVSFEIRRAAGDKPQDLNLVVESAYHQTNKPPRLLGRMGFILLCGKIHMRQPTSTKR